MKNFDELLMSLSACQEARTWAKGKTFTEVWETCDRGDWLLWLLGKMADKENWPSRKQVVLSNVRLRRTGITFCKTKRK